METMAKHNVSSGHCGCSCKEPVQNEVATERVEEKSPRRAYIPAVDIMESKEGVDLVVDVPGVAEGGVELTIEKNILMLSAVPSDGVIAGKKLIYSEYGVGEYRRSFTLSDEVDQEHVSASLKNGVLRIHLPKIAPATRKINVSVS